MISKERLEIIINISGGESIVMNMFINGKALKKGYHGVYQGIETITREECEKKYFMVPLNKIK